MTIITSGLQMISAPVVTVPGAPTIGVATGGNGSATVAFTPPASNGGSPITSYVATSSPGGFTGTGGASPLTVNGLSNGTAYTFTVVANNIVGPSSPSGVSNSVTPSSGAGVPGQVTSVVLYSSGSPGHLYSTGKIAAAGSGGATTGFGGALSPSGITGTSSVMTNPITGLSCRVDYHGVPNVAQTATMTQVNSSGSSTPSAASNSATAAAIVDSLQSAVATMIGYGGSVPSGMSPLWRNNFFDFANLRDVSPGQATVPTSFVPTANAPAAPVGFGTINKFLEVTPQGSSGYAVLLSIFQDNPAAGNNGAFDISPFLSGYFFFLVYKISAASGNFVSQPEMTANYEGVITNVSGSTVTDANQNFGGSFNAGLTALFNHNTGSGIGYTSNTSNTFQATSGSWNIGDHYDIQQGDIAYGNGITDYASRVISPVAGVFTLNAWNLVKVKVSDLGVVGLNNNLFYKAAIGAGTPSPTDVFWLCNVGWSVS